MRKLLLAMVVCLFSLTCFSSCVTTAHAYDYDYHPYNESENVVVVDEICYVYYTNPTTLFLNSLHIIDGAYYYWHTNRYIPVVFPYWEVWSPHRFFYYDRNHWTWRDRHHGYNHLEYRRSQHWVDHRKPKPHHVYHQRPHQNTKPHQPSHNVRPTNPTTHPRVNSQPHTSRSGSTFRPSSTRTTVNHGSFSGGARPQHGGRR